MAFLTTFSVTVHSFARFLQIRILLELLVDGAVKFVTADSC